MDINVLVNQLKRASNDHIFLHDMALPISARKMYELMRNPNNWQVVNFPIINKVEVIKHERDKITFFLYEKLFNKYFKSQIELTYDDDAKRIEYYHVKPTFPFVNKMASIWIFDDDGAYTSHFYIVRRFNVKNVFIKYCLFWFLRMVINKHVNDYYEQLVALTKVLTLNPPISNNKL